MGTILTYKELLEGLGVSASPVSPGALIADQSVYILESTTALGGGLTFTGPLRDTTMFNYFGAKASADVAGTLFIDESDAPSAAPIYQVATQATSAAPAAHGSPASNATGFETRIAHAKALLRYTRVVYVNGAGAQASFRLNSSQSPLN